MSLGVPQIIMIYDDIEIYHVIVICVIIGNDEEVSCFKNYDLSIDKEVFEIDYTVNLVLVSSSPLLG